MNISQRDIFENVFGRIINHTIIILLLGLTFLFSILTPEVFLSTDNIHNLARQISFNTIVAFGQVTVLITKGIDLSVGSVLALSAAIVIGFQDLGIVIAIILALLMGIVVGFLNGWLVSKIKIPAFIVTLGTMTLVYGIVLTYTKQQSIIGKVDSFTILGSGSIGPLPIPTLIMLILLFIFHMMLNYTKLGRYLYAIGSNEQATFQASVRIVRYKILAFTISGFCAALAGILLASRLNSSSIHIGQQTALFVITGCIMGGASILGGKGSALGAFLGVLTLGVLINGMRLLSVFTYNQLAIQALLFITVVAVDAFYVNKVKNRIIKSKF